MNALLFLELRYAAHNVAAVLRSPFRLILWGGYLLVLGSGLAMRLIVRSSPSSGFSARHGDAALALASVVAGMLALSIGITVVGASLGRVATFRTRAEALLFSNGGVPPLRAALWLQLRRIASTFGRRLTTLALYFVIFVPQRAGDAREEAFGFAGILGAFALLLGLELPIYLLARRGWDRLLIAAGALLALYGGAYALAAFAALAVRLPLALALLRATPLDLGGFARAIVLGRLPALGALVALVLVTVAAALALGRDSLPELYAAAERGLELRERARGKGSRFATRGASGAAARVPAGALAIVWKDWLGAKRARGAPQAWTIAAAVAIALGGGLAYLLEVAGGAAAAAPLLGGIFAILILSPIGTARGLAADFGKPIWWLGASSPRARVHALVFARSWRGAAVVALGLVSAATVLGEPGLALAAPIGALALWWSLGALGAALYTLFPYDVDRRGPLVLVRAIVVAIYFGPVVAIAALLGIAGAPTPAIVLAAAALLAAEGFGSVEIASLRIVENGAGLASFERIG